MSLLYVIACFSALSLLAPGVKCKRMQQLEAESLGTTLAQCPEDLASMTQAIENMHLTCIYNSKSLHMQDILSGLAKEYKHCPKQVQDTPEVQKLIIKSLFDIVLSQIIDPHTESKFMTRGVMEEVVEAECNLSDDFFSGLAVQEVMGQLVHARKEALEVMGEPVPEYFSDRNSFPTHMILMLRHFIKYYTKMVLVDLEGLPQQSQDKKEDMQAAESAVEMTTNMMEQKWKKVPQLAASNMPPEILRTRRFQREIRQQVRDAWNGLVVSTPKRLISGTFVPAVPASELLKKDIGIHLEDFEEEFLELSA
eukprot:gnl/MRDRNA2_/MRDRNA2_71070_c0_seq1.p1 gnl/MRDRNA2_/MRDRNA2_71070_c0~~gnl/MRDRNA2_/MRDRNA2_71070_c0_seq1.p1  ORF type:complete len:333 (+),score=75.08 gnl/MRDRNA2_/MRDRNA2_71070_c0_seq1:73-999(+)